MLLKREKTAKVGVTGLAFDRLQVFEALKAMGARVKFTRTEGFVPISR